ncbi:MAG: 2-hydroxychromene-2-carboxylate isomerase [Ectothiorhodospiraceae bacterium]|nr:2-hydroxychromene-2-carboxylate isomerase [Ectothiorhodospiraceae bacterium]
MTLADWYFDFISPYSYLAYKDMGRVADRLELRLHPVLFAGLLNHWGQKGPAELGPKRVWTYRWCTWWAQRNGIPFRMPAVHPFNPIAYLRLAHAAGCTPEAVGTIFDALWTSGADPRDPVLIEELTAKLGVDQTAIGEPRVKEALRERTNQAIAQGVFGVPSFCINGHVFWGADALGLVQDYLADPALFDSSEMKRVSALPVGAERTG